MPGVELAGKPIAITGASSGIGRAAAIACARAGMPVGLGARRGDRLHALTDEIARDGGRALAVTCDVADPRQTEALVARTVEAFGSIYAVFANAGYTLETPTPDMTDADLRALLETNFFGTLNTIRPALARMREAGCGHVLVCSSCLSKIAVPHYAAYTISKAAQDFYARALRIELDHTSIHVSTVHPIGTRTELFEKAADRIAHRRLIDGSSDRFMQSPDRVARAVLSCLRRPRPEVWTSQTVRLVMSLSTVSPRLTDAALGRLLTRRLARLKVRR